MTISAFKPFSFLPLIGALSLVACGDDEDVEPKSCDVPGVGCSCDDATDHDVCVYGVGLECSDGRWVKARGEEGPCFLPEFDEEDDCFSPFQNLDQAYSDGAEGCACEDTGTNRAGYCVEGAALHCDEGKWISVEDGACGDRVSITREACENDVREVLLDPGDGSVLSAGCPAPLATLDRVTDGTRDIGLCCTPIELSSQECVAIGGQALSDPGDNSVNEAGCPDDRKQLGRLNSGAEGGLCCAP